MAERAAVREVRVSYFALLRDETGRDEEQVATAGATAGELYAQLQERYRLSLPRERLRVAINASFAEWDTALADGDVVVFIPPVAGG